MDGNATGGVNNILEGTVQLTYVPYVQPHGDNYNFGETIQLTYVQPQPTFQLNIPGYNSGRGSTWEQAFERDKFAIGLGAANAIVSLAYLATPPSHAKLALGLVGGGLTSLSVGYTIYQFVNNDISKTEFAISLATDLTPFVGKSLAPEAAKGIAEVVVNVVEHEIGIGEVLYESFIKPYQQ